MDLIENESDEESDHIQKQRADDNHQSNSQQTSQMSNK
jgi:hypothetical protein